jgi:HEPN domain-containing protein
METKFALSETSQQGLLGFFENHDIRLFSQNLRRQFIDYLQYELRIAVPLYFDKFLYPFNELLDLLDTIAAELQQFDVAEKIDQQPILKYETTKNKVIAFLKATLSPERIFLLHHDKNDNCEYFDLLIVMPGNAQTNFNQYEQIVSMANIEGAVINVSLHQSATLQKQLAEGHIYYSMACNKENLIYDNGSTSFPPIDKTLLYTACEKANATFYNSRIKANSFLQGAADYYKDQDITITAFMLHQSVELALRGLITALLGNCAKTHCLRELKRPLKRCAPGLKYLLSASEAEENRLLHLLEKAYLESRYNDAFDISDNDIIVLMEASKTLCERAERTFTEKINRLM